MLCYATLLASVFTQYQKFDMQEIISIFWKGKCKKYVGGNVMVYVILTKSEQYDKNKQYYAGFLLLINLRRKK